MSPPDRGAIIAGRTHPLKLPFFVIGLPERHEGERRIGEALRAQLPPAFPDFGFEFQLTPIDDLAFSVVPVVGTAGDGGRMFDRQPTDDEIAQVRATVREIVRRAEP